MRILFCRCFGIGNAVMAIPTIKSLFVAGHEIDVLVGNTPDDVGALEVMRLFSQSLNKMITVHMNQAPMNLEYDMAILSIPFDGRWQQGVHFRSKTVVDGRTRPDPSTTGLVSWKKHEVEYQLETVKGFASNLKYVNYDPDCRFLPPSPPDPKKIYLGVGYKKDTAGFWKVKHWGNENYVQLVKMLLRDDKGLQIISTGDMGDIQHSLAPIVRGLDGEKRFFVHSTNLENSFKLVSNCDMYIGNDTGMMHVAAAAGRKVAAVFNLENSIVKSRPWCKDYRALDGSKTPVTVEQFYQAIKELQSV